MIVAEDRKTVSIQGGCLWGDVYSELEKYDLIVVGGNTWFVGVGGYLTGGGYSNLTGQHGLAVDNLVGAEVVLADGRIVRCSEVEEPDLFWAIRGVYFRHSFVDVSTEDTYLRRRQPIWYRY